MGLHVYCENNKNNNDIQCSYSFWNAYRTFIVKCVIAYLQNEVQKFDDLKRLNSIMDISDDETELNDKYNSNKYYIDSIKKLLHFYDIIISQKENPHVGFLKIYCDDSPEMINALIYFNIYGAYILCNKQDNSGFYSSGNSLDILLCFNTIKNFFSTEHILQSDIFSYDKTQFHDEIFSTTNELITLLQESISTNTKICLS